jgi:hypothetical protein
MLLPASRVVLTSIILVLAAGCGGNDSADARSNQQVSTTSSERSSESGTYRSVEERRAALLNRIRSSDPRKETIERAMINEKNELGLILSRQTNLDDVPRLMKAMLTQMAEDFPGQDLAVVAYTPTDPPRTIGTARLDSRTRDMTYHSASE